MFQGQLLNFNSSVYTPWMSRRGDFLRATAELLDVSSTGTLTVEVFTKNSEDPGNGTDADTSKDISLSSGNPLDTTEWGPHTGAAPQGLQELVRFKFTCGGSSGDWVLFRMLPAVWFDAVSV